MSVSKKWPWNPLDYLKRMMLSIPKKESPPDPGKGIHILIPSWPSFAPSRIEDGMAASLSACKQNCRRRSLSFSKHADVEGTTHRRHKSM